MGRSNRRNQAGVRGIVWNRVSPSLEAFIRKKLTESSEISDEKLLKGWLHSEDGQRLGKGADQDRLLKAITRYRQANKSVPRSPTSSLAKTKEKNTDNKDRRGRAIAKESLAKFFQSGFKVTAQTSVDEIVTSWLAVTRDPIVKSLDRSYLRSLAGKSRKTHLVNNVCPDLSKYTRNQVKKDPAMTNHEILDSWLRARDPDVEEVFGRQWLIKRIERYRKSSAPAKRHRAKSDKSLSGREGRSAHSAKANRVIDRVEQIKQSIYEYVRTGQRYNMKPKDLVEGWLWTTDGRELKVKKSKLKGYVEEARSQVLKAQEQQDNMMPDPVVLRADATFESKGSMQPRYDMAPYQGQGNRKRPPLDDWRL